MTSSSLCRLKTTVVLANPLEWIENHFFVTAGQNDGDSLTEILVWDPSTESWQHAGDLARFSHAAVAIPSSIIESECSAMFLKWFFLKINLQAAVVLNLAIPLIELISQFCIFCFTSSKSILTLVGKVPPVSMILVFSRISGSEINCLQVKFVQPWSA